MHKKHIVYQGLPLSEAKRAMILVHGRGASAASILTLAPYLNVADFALLAPEATTGAWYPYSFIAPKAQNEPWLSSALGVLEDTLKEIQDAGISSENIYLLGFSQGACLSVEFAARHAQRFGGVFVLSGGLIGDQIDSQPYTGDFAGTPIFLGCSDRDAHIPLRRVQESTEVLRRMGAEVKERIYPGMPHTVSEDEIGEVNEILG
ncbi:MAG: phospholipase [Bacteroidetes bacterium]|nr:MAG: phospholipase [Bacteroidota bacterium]